MLKLTVIIQMQIKSTTGYHFTLKRLKKKNYSEKVQIDISAIYSLCPAGVSAN